MDTLMTIDIDNFSSHLKLPLLSTKIKIKSETVLKSYNDLYHTFTLPLLGDYSHNFVICSDYVLKGFKDHILAVDSLSNYIDSITLNLNNRSTVLSCIDQLPIIETLNTISLSEQLLIKLNFLNLPILTKCVTGSDFMIVIKFKQTPPINYVLSYDLSFVADENYAEILSRECFAIRYMSHQSHDRFKLIQLIYNKGHVSLN